MSRPQHHPDEAIELLGKRRTTSSNSYEKHEEHETRRESANQDTLSEAAHLKSTIALCVVSLTNSYLLISVFPYSGFLAMDLIENANEENAGSYAGLISSSFMIGRAISSIAWGRAADTYGRTTALCASLCLSCIFSILFGIAPTFFWAMFSRFLMGLGNGSIGITKTAVSELAGSNSKLETRGMGLVMGMWSWGFLFSPAISGALAEPVRQYPNNHLVHKFHGILSRYPFLLPNLVCSVLCIVAIVAVSIWVDETLPKDQLRSIRQIPWDVLSCCQKVFQFGRDTQQNADDPSVRECLDNNRSPSMLSKHSEQKATIASLWRRKSTRTHLLLYWAYSFTFICNDEAFPLFCMSKAGGLAISEASIGKLLSGSGLVFALFQYCSYAVLVHRCGLYPSIHIGAILACPVMMFVPVSLLLNKGSPEGELRVSTFVFLSLIMSVSRIFASAFFSSMTIATNRTVPSSQRATMNGLSMLGGSASKGFGPAFAGLLVAFSLSSGVFQPRGGAVFVFCVIGSLGLIATIWGYFNLSEDSTTNGNDEDSEDRNDERCNRDVDEPIP